ncbi:MAG: glutaredoxin [Pseudobutyrivibrio sp.]|nr:glutaredoxin [Pseudobutyrivibrio sp.]
MIKVYGSRHCPDCINFEHNLNKNGLEFEFVDINENMPNLKEFLRMRDTNPAFDKTKQYGYVGIPAIVYEDGSIDLHWKNYLENKGITIEYVDGEKKACSIDGKGC